jgi:hypothetical protein
VNRATGLCAVLAAACALGACSKQSEDPAASKSNEVPASVTKGAAAAGAAVETKYGTPVKDRVATLGLLNKRNNLTQDLVLKVGEARRIGNLVVRLSTCERTLPWETAPETGAFVQVYAEERANADASLAWRTVFSGWLFKNSPSLNVVEHPVYDVWVKDCAMKFPGEEEDPPAAATSAAKPSGSASGAPAAKAAPAASPTPEPKAAPAPAPKAVPKA